MSPKLHPLPKSSMWVTYESDKAKGKEISSELVMLDWSSFCCMDLCSSMLLLVFLPIPCRKRSRVFFKHTPKLSPSPSGNGDPDVLFTSDQKVFIEDYLGPLYPEYSSKTSGVECLYDRRSVTELGAECIFYRNLARYVSVFLQHLVPYRRISIYNSSGIFMHILNYEAIILILVGYFRYMISFILFINKYEK